MHLMSIEHETLLRMAQAGGELERWDGGYWTTPGQPPQEQRVWPAGFLLPRWYVSFVVVRSLEAKGLLVRAGVWAAEWRDRRRLSEAGWAWASTASAA